jgi:hypothetical protein
MAGPLCYDAADPIIALYEANRLRQVADGAAGRARTCNIPNGISLQRFAPLRALRPETPPPVLCLIGRVVPIKDVKTFIRAMRRVGNQMPAAEGWIAGPEDEDPAYAEECRNLVRSLGLADKVKFLGFQKVEELLPKIGLVVLSSISEALPLVILEGYAAGVPTVSTDVGSCRQLIEGLDGDDRPGRFRRRRADRRAAGAGRRRPRAARRPGGLAAASRAAIARVERYYTDDLMFGATAASISGRWPPQGRRTDGGHRLRAAQAAAQGHPARPAAGLHLRRHHRLRPLGAVHRRHPADRPASAPAVVVPSFLVTQFQTSVTYLIACSLILTGLVCSSPSPASSPTACSKAGTPSCPTSTACCC